MCGIAGIFGERDEGTLEQMIDCISHRGPDDAGTYFDDNLSLGMRRLSIVGVDSGHQPIHNEDKTVWTIFNGEIYNYEELRNNLEEKGHEFYTEADTEVLVHLYEEHGRDFVEMLNGMYAFSIWDEDERELLLYRDRLGIKPIYYAEKGGKFYFGSEPRSILRTDLNRQPDLEGLSYYWHLGYIPAPHSAFEGIKKLEPGHYLSITEKEIEKTKYWELDGNPDSSKSEDYYIEKLRGLIEDSVEKRMMSDVPLGAFLSGGVDSSTVVGLMSKLSDEPVNTFSVVFEDEEHDERDHSRLVADYFDTNHTEFEVDIDTAERAERILKQMDEPLADPAIIPTHIIAEKASERVKVVNTGSGADELFAGYNRYKRDYERWEKLEKIPSPFTEILDFSAELLPKYTKLWYYTTYIASSKSQLENFTTMTERDTQMPQEDLSDIEGLYEPIVETEKDMLYNSTGIDINVWLPGDLLTKVDRATMANSLEARVPFLDHRLVEFSRKIPSDMKVKDGNEKNILKEAISDLLPEQIIEREKDGFGVPTEDWLKQDTPLSKRFEKSKFEKIDFLNEEKIMSRYNAFLDGKKDRDNFLWKALNLQIWHEEYIED